jgi:hypothetical protein
MDKVHDLRVVSVFIRTGTKDVAYHTCFADSVPDVFRQHITHMMYVPILPSIAQVFNKDPSPVVGEGSEPNQLCLPPQSDTATPPMLNVSVCTLTLNVLTLNVAGIELDAVAAALDVLFGTRRRALHRFRTLVLCIIAKAVGIDLTTYMHSSKFIDTNNIDECLFAVRFSSRLPDEIREKVKNRKFTEATIIDACKNQGVFPAELSRAISPVLMTPKRSSGIPFFGGSVYEMDTFKTCPGNNIQTGMIPICVYAKGPRPLLVVHLSPTEEESIAFRVTDGAHIHQVAPMQFVVKLPRCGHDMFVCTLPVDAILELMDTTDVYPLTDKGESKSYICARACLARYGMCANAQCNVLKLRHGIETITQPHCTEITIKKTGCTISHDTGTIVAVTDKHAVFRSHTTRKDIHLDISLPNVSINAVGLLTTVLCASDDDQSPPLSFVRFDHMQIGSQSDVDIRLLRTTSIKCMNAETTPAVFLRNACTDCAICDQMFSNYKNELLLPKDVLPSHVICALIPSELLLRYIQGKYTADDVASICDTYIASTNASLGFDDDPDVHNACALKRALRRTLTCQLQPGSTFTSDIEHTALVRYILHQSNILPHINTLLSVELQQCLAAAHFDEYLQYQIQCMKRGSSYLFTGSDIWIDMNQTNTHAQLCKTWDLPDTTMFVGTKRITAVIPTDDVEYKTNSVLSDGINAYRICGNSFITMYRVKCDRTRDIFAFAQCRNGNDRVIRTKTGEHQHASFKSRFRLETNETCEHVLSRRKFRCTKLPELPIVTHVACIFLNRQLVSEQYMIGDKEIMVHLCE